MQFMRQAGFSFDGERDLYEILGYPEVITAKEYRDRYARGGIAKRIVEAFPKATWRGGGELMEDENPNVSTAFEDAWDELNKRLKIWQQFQRVDILAGLSTYAVLLIGAPGEFSQPLPKGAPEKLTYLQPYIGEGGPNAMRAARAQLANSCSIHSWETDAANPRFELPLFYQLKRQDVASPMLTQPVHWTRIVHVAEGCLEDEVYGQPTLENIWNLLDDLDKVTGGGAEAFWLRANQGLQLDVDKDMAPLTVDEKKALAEQADEYQHNIRRMLRTRGVTVNTLGSDVANFANPADAILTQIAGAKGIPKRILTGSEMGELASSQDRDNWKDQINGRQTGYAGPFIIRVLVDRLIEYGYLPKPGEEYEVVWPQIQVLTEQEKSEGALKWAQVNSTQGKPVFLSEEIRDKWYSLEPLTPEQIEADKPPVPVGPDGKPVAVDANGKPVPIIAPDAKPENKPEPKAASAHESEDVELIEVLAAAITANNTDVIDRIIGVQRAAQAQDIVINMPTPHEPAPPNVIINQEAPKPVKKTFQYSLVDGIMRPTGVTVD